MERELRALLQVELDVPAARINWGQHMGDAAAAYLVLNLISLNEDLTMQGPDGLEMARVQIDAYAMDFGQANSTGRAVKALLHGYRGGGFQLIEFAGMRHLRESGEDASDGIYRASLDFLTHWRDENAG